MSERETGGAPHLRVDGRGRLLVIGERWLRGSLLGSLPLAEQEQLVRLGSQRTFDGGAVIIHEGAPDRRVYLLMRGCVKVVSVTTDGHAALLAVRLEGDVVGELAAIDDLPRSATVVAVTRTTARVISGHEFHAHLDASPLLADMVRRTVVAKLRQATRFRIEGSGASATVRLARVLAQLDERYGQDTPQGRLLAVHLTQSDLGAMIGVSKSSAERAVGELRERGLVRTGYRQILMPDRAGLVELVRDGR